MDGQQDKEASGGRSADAKLVDGEAIDGQPLVFAALAFLFIFLAYAAGGLAMPEVGLVLPSFAAGDAAPTPAASEIPDLLIWWAFAFLAMVLAIIITGWCTRLLRRHCPTPVYKGAIAFLATATIVAAVLAYDAGNAMVELSRGIACRSAQSHLYCAVPHRAELPDDLVATPGSDRKDAKATAKRNAEALGRQLNAFKTLLNMLLQMASIFVIGTMLVITAVRFRAPDRSHSYFERLVKESTLTRLLAAAGAVLSIITLTDVLFTNWPIRALGPKSADAPALTALLGTLTFYYALLGSMVLALGMIFSRALAETPLPLFSRVTGAEAGTLMQRVGRFFTQKATINALLALSPVLTYAFSNPLLDAALDALRQGA